MNWYKTSSNKVMIICRGVPGSGKSTLAQKLGKGGVVFTTDDYFYEDGEYKHDPSKLVDAHKWNIKRTRKAAEKGIYPIVIDNTNIQFWEIKFYVEIAQEYGYEVKFAEPDWSPELKDDEGKWNFDFLRGRNKHDVPDEGLQQKIDAYEYDPTIEKILKSKRPEL